jgi:hypothetical protein
MRSIQQTCENETSPAGDIYRATARYWRTQADSAVKNGMFNIARRRRAEAARYDDLALTADWENVLKTYQD